jgi:hypothetical protein
MSHCPEWIFDAVASQVANEYLAQEMPIRSIAKKYSDGLSEKYHSVSVEEIETVSEEMIRALDEVNAEGEAVTLLNSYTFFRIVYEGNNNKRKMKPLFGSVDAPTPSKNYNIDSSVKRFKAYLFSVRSSVAVLAPSSWKLSTFEDLPFLKKMAEKSVNILDIL